MQKFKLPLLIGGVLLLAVALFFFFFNSLSAFDAIPKSAIGVLEVNNWDQFAGKLSTTSTGSQWKKTNAAQKLLGEIALTEELLSGDKSLKEVIGSAKTLASVHLTFADDYDFLFTTELPGVNDNTILNHLQASAKVRSVNVRIFKSQKIVDVNLRDGKQFSFAKLKDILAFSFTPFLTENAMTALITGDNLGHDKSFKMVRSKISSSADMNLYFNFQKADVILPVVMRAERIAQLSDVKASGNWGHYNVSFGSDKMELDGDISTVNETAPVEQNILTENLFSKIPDHVAYVQLSKTDTGGNEMLKSYFKNWMGNTKAFAILEPLKADFTEQNVFVLSVKNKQKATEDLKHLAAQGNAQAIAADTFLTSEIYTLKDGSIINQLFGNSLVTFKSPCFTVREDAVIFCNNIDVLKLLLEKISKGETLDKDKAFLSTSYSRFGMNSGMEYLNFERADLLLKGMLKEKSSVGPFISSFKNVLVISNVLKGKTSSRLVFGAGSESKTSSAGLLWKTKLQFASISGPQIVLNGNTGEKEIFVQDTANNIYLISQSGEILFTKNIEEPILGKVEQLDYYNNGKLQYIFNSAHHIFIVDRLGNDVGSYPLRLSAAASCGMTLVKGTSGNRYYIPCSNGSIYGYEGNGKPLSGWSPRNGVGVVSKPLQWFNNKKNDFMLAFNNAGRLMLMDAKGNTKWSVDNLPVTKQGFSVVKLNDDFKLLNAHGNQLTEISSDGNDNIKPLVDTAGSFCVLSTSDSSYNYFFSSGKQVRAYNNKGEFQSAASVSGANISSMEVMDCNGGNVLLMRDETSKQLFIYDTALNLVASFNYSSGNDGNEPVVADLFNRNELVVLVPDMAGNINGYRIK